MLGVFSTAEPGNYIHRSLKQYFVYDDLTLMIRDLSNGSPKEETFAWEPRSEASYYIPKHDDDTNRGYGLIVARTEECGPHDVFLFSDNGLTLSEQLYRGEVCVRAAEPNDGGEAGFDYYWCDEAPPPCE